MQSVSVKSRSTHYLVEIQRATLAKGATVLEENSQPIAVLLPIEDYQAYRQWQEERQNLPPATPTDFAREVESFERLRPTLQAQYAGQAVAIHGGKVVASGNDKMALLAQVWQELGPVPCYVEWVEAAAPRRVRVPSAWVRR